MARKKRNTRLNRLLGRQDSSKVYVSQDTIFIDANIVHRVRRKALQMQGQLSLHFMGKHYQSCLEELGLWDMRKEDET